jgi:F-type H+-transporting ATPase subunit a
MHISLAAEKIIEVGPVAITNTMLVSWVVILFLAIVAFFVRKNLKAVPGKLQNIAEFTIEAILGMIEGVTADRKKAERMLPLIATFFIFIITANWMGLIPGFETIGKWETLHGETFLVPFLRPPAADLNTTLALAIISVVAIQIFGFGALGFKYIVKFINFKSPIDFFVGVLEGISEFAKIISFTFRLFGNVFAGGVLLAVVSFLIPYVVAVPFYGLELFVGFVQALVFAMLTTVFIHIATLSHDTEHAEH